MPEHVLMSEIEIITDGGRRRRWSAAEKLRIVEVTLDDRASISVVARRIGVAPNLLYRWRLDGVVAIISPDRLSAAGLAVFDSDGFDRDGNRFDRRGRATVALARAEIGADWVAVHTHMSLFRGTPDQSFGQFAAE